MYHGQMSNDDMNTASCTGKKYGVNCLFQGIKNFGLEMIEEIYKVMSGKTCNKMLCIVFVHTVENNRSGEEQICVVLYIKSFQLTFNNNT